MLGAGSAGDFNGVTGITAAVPADQTTGLRATATDAAGNASSCSAPFPYTEDSTAPNTPAIDDTDPNSPANDNSPEVKGIAEFGSTVRIYDNPTCTGVPIASGPAAAFNSDGITTPVPDDQTTGLRATATDQPSNTSACSAALAYTEDSTAPAAPTITDTDPDSPANENNPEFKGTAEAGSEVVLYRSSDCSDTNPGAVGAAAEFASPGLTVSVADNSTTTLRATARDQAGNISPCSSPFSYTENSTVPDTTPPDVDLGGKTTQKFDGSIEVEVQCSEACEVTAEGSVTIKGGAAKRAGKTKLKLRKLTVDLAAGERGVLGMKLSQEREDAEEAARSSAPRRRRPSR